MEDRSFVICSSIVPSVSMHSICSCVTERIYGRKGSQIESMNLGTYCPGFRVDLGCGMQTMLSNVGRDFSSASAKWI